MSEHLDLWNRLGKTDPKHTKTFKRAGGFSGTAIKPMWSYKRMTEEFGPCGTGWGLGEPQFQVVPGPEGEMLVYCTASVWYGESRHTVYGVGGDKAVGKNKFGLVSDDEAFKKAFTDAVTNALKMIGVGADVHMGLFDDSKYVNTIQREFADEQPVEIQPKPVSAAQMKRGLEQIDQDLLDCHTVPDVLKCAGSWKATMEREGWSKDYREFARGKFEARRDAIKSKPAEDDFPGDMSSAA